MPIFVQWGYWVLTYVIYWILREIEVKHVPLNGLLFLLAPPDFQTFPRPWLRCSTFKIIAAVIMRRLEIMFWKQACSVSAWNNMKISSWQIIEIPFMANYQMNSALKVWEYIFNHRWRHMSNITKIYHDLLFSSCIWLYITGLLHNRKIPFVLWAFNTKVLNTSN